MERDSGGGRGVLSWYHPVLSRCGGFIIILILKCRIHLQAFQDFAHVGKICFVELTIYNSF